MNWKAIGLVAAGLASAGAGGYYLWSDGKGKPKEIVKQSKAVLIKKKQKSIGSLDKTELKPLFPKGISSDLNQDKVEILACPPTPVCQEVVIPSCSGPKIIYKEKIVWRDRPPIIKERIVWRDRLVQPKPEKPKAIGCYPDWEKGTAFGVTRKGLSLVCLLDYKNRRVKTEFRRTNSQRVEEPVIRRL